MEQTIERIFLEEQPGIDKAAAADFLQNDVNQTLAAVLLWLQSAMEDKELGSNLHLKLAETNLKDSIKKLVRLHYSLLESSDNELAMY